MKNHSGVRDLFYRTSPAQWSTELLEVYSNDVLVNLCMINGIHHSGTKAQKITRLLQTRDVFARLAPYNDTDEHKNAGQMCQDMKRREIYAMVCVAGTWKGGNKYGLSIGLLSWRARLREDGARFRQEVLDEAKTFRATTPRQVVMRLELTDE